MEELNAGYNHGMQNIFIPELSVLNLLFENTNFKIFIKIILSLLKQHQYFMSYKIKSCHLLSFKFKIELLSVLLYIFMSIFCSIP